MRGLNLLSVVAGVAVVAIFAGCQTREVAVVKDTPAVIQHNQSAVSNAVAIQPLKYYTKVAKRRIVIDVVDLTANKDFKSIGKSVSGSIANSGFEVGATNSYLVVSLKNSLGKFDKLGNFYVYKGKSEITVNRTRLELLKDVLGQNTLIARKTIIATGERKLGKDDAIASLAEKLGASTAKWVDTVCKREVEGLQAEKIDFDMAIFTAAFTGLKKAKGINLFLSTIAKKQGVLSCVQISDNNKKLSIECVYRKKDYPNGVVNKGEVIIPKLTSDTLKKRVSELTKYLLK